MISESHVNEMKELVKIAKEKNEIIDASKVFTLYPPEGTWCRDSNGSIAVKELKNEL